MIKAKGISKTYDKRVVIDKLDITVNTGELFSITGESGSGKTTLLNILGLLENVDSGSVELDNHVNPNKREKMLLQREKIGYLFQNYGLIENETVEENLKIALTYKKMGDKKEKIREALGFVGLETYMKRKIFQLSGGEQQRIALARVFLKEPCYIFADEPTGNLDSKNRDVVFGLLKELNDSGKTVVYVTHDMNLALKATNSIDL